YSPDGRMLAVATRNDDGASHVALWEVCSGKKRWQAPLPARPDALAFGEGGQVLVTGHADTTALLWDVSGRRQRARALDAKGWDALVKDLKSDDAAKAFEAQRTLAASRAVGELRSRLKPAAGKPLSEKEMAALVKDLDDDDFDVRDKAYRSLR